MADEDEWPGMDYIEAVCRIGQGALCCRYLTMGADGWHCAKNTPLRRLLDERVAAGAINARGDNCEGR
jgi:hypothetical protein